MKSKKIISYLPERSYLNKQMKVSEIIDYFADLAIEKIVSPHYPKMNDVVTWTVTVTNNGKTTLNNVNVYKGTLFE